MGITIHYQGSLPDRKKIKQLRKELIDISEGMGWNNILVQRDEENDTSHPPVYGIVMDLQNGCEPLSFIFDQQGRLRSFISLNYHDENDKNQLITSVKTQFASPEVHICIIELLRYIKKVYIHDLKVTDEGQYWDTSDEEKLKYLFKFISEKIDLLCDILEGNEETIKNAPNTETLVDKLQELFKKHLGPDADIKRIDGWE